MPRSGRPSASTKKIQQRLEPSEVDDNFLPETKNRESVDYDDLLSESEDDQYQAEDEEVDKINRGIPMDARGEEEFKLIHIPVPAFTESQITAGKEFAPKALFNMGTFFDTYQTYLVKYNDGLDELTHDKSYEELIVLLGTMKEWVNYLSSTSHEILKNIPDENPGKEAWETHYETHLNNAEFFAMKKEIYEDMLKQQEKSSPKRSRSNSK